MSARVRVCVCVRVCANGKLKFVPGHVRAANGASANIAARILTVGTQTHDPTALPIPGSTYFIAL
jgi:hypothetical protein